MLRDPKNMFDAIAIVQQHSTQMQFYVSNTPGEKFALVGLERWAFVVGQIDRPDGNPNYGFWAIDETVDFAKILDQSKSTKQGFTNAIESNQFLKCLTNTADFFNAMAGNTRSFIQCSETDMQDIYRALAADQTKAYSQAAEATDPDVKKGFKHVADRLEGLTNRVAYQYNAVFNKKL